MRERAVQENRTGEPAMTTIITSTRATTQTTYSTAINAAARMAIVIKAVNSTKK
jgi:hypothetical protein